MNINTRGVCIASVLGFISLIPVLADQIMNHAESGHREILLETTKAWNGTPYTHYPTGQPQLTTIKVTLAPHTALPWHTHPFPNSVYVLSGTLPCVTDTMENLWSFIKGRPSPSR